jgi:TPR repeat protein
MSRIPLLLEDCQADDTATARPPVSKTADAMQDAVHCDLPYDHFSPADYAGSGNDIDTMRQSLERLAATGKHATDAENITRSIEDGYAQISRMLEASASQQVKLPGFSVAGSAEYIILSEYIIAMRDNADRLAAQFPTEDLQTLLEEIDRVIARLSRAGENALINHFVTLEEKLDELNRQLGMLPAATDAGLNPLQDLQDRITDFVGTVEQLVKAESRIHEGQEEKAVQTLPDIEMPQSGNAASTKPDTTIVKMLGEILSRIENIPALPGGAGPAHDPEIFDATDQKLQQISEKLDNAAAGQQEDESRLVKQLHLMQSHLQTIASQLETAVPAQTQFQAEFATQFQTLAARLDSLEQRVTLTRDFAVDVAGQAAERALKMIRERDSGSLKAINERLAGIVERLNNMELEALAEAVPPVEAEKKQPVPVQNDQQAFEALGPELASLDAGSGPALQKDIPLERGSGTPDLAALVRRAGERRKQDIAGQTDRHERPQDYLAAARRATQAAAKAAQEVDSGSRTNLADTSGVPGLLTGFARLLHRNTLPAIIAVLATTTILVSLPFAGSWFDMAASAVSNPETEPALLNAKSGSRIAEINQPVIDKSESSVTAVSSQDNPEPSLLQPVITDEKPRIVDTSALAIDAQTIREISAPPDAIDNPALRDAAIAGNPAALFEIARRYTEGEQVERDIEQAFYWYERAAQAGLPPAQFRLGNLYEMGLGTHVDPVKAGQWYEYAARQGNVLAMHNLAVLHISGFSADKADMGAAIKWFRKAADLGVKDSQVNLGIIFAGGLGVGTDLAEAYKWFAIAAKAGDSDAALKRDAIAGSMHPEQLEAALRAANNWQVQPVNESANNVEIDPQWQQAAFAPAPIPGTGDILRAQTLLSRLGYNPGPADGIAGERTLEAIRQYQRETGLEEDGQITSELLDSLDENSV